jgi:hypothetical protein
MNSFSQNAGPNKLLHLHILDPDDHLRAYVSSLLDKLKLCNVAMTVEQTSLAQSGSDHFRKTFYTCSRFLHMNALLHRYDVPIACFDIDTIFEAPIDALTSASVGHDVGLFFREPPDSPWLDVIANTVVAHNTRRAQAYFAAVSNFIRYFAARAELFWHVDQIALYCVLVMMQRFSEPPAVAPIGQGEEMPVWHIGHLYDFRLHEERFARYRIAD